jgi:MFS transporter, NNP family, nitrate/nitrite transporter
VGAMIIFSLFVQMSEGATFSVVPFVNRKSLGPVAGIVGAGGNAGAVAAGFLLRIENLSTEQALLYLGVGVALVAPVVLLVRFSAQNEAEEKKALEHALTERALAERLAPVSAERGG